MNGEKKKAKQKECYIELASFEDLTRMACAQHPKRIYSFDLDGICVAAITMNLGNTHAVMYAPLPKNEDGGRYISYKIDDVKKESCKITDTISNGSVSAPIIYLKSNITYLESATSRDEIPDVFNPIELKDIGSLARLTYDPEVPDESELTLYAMPVNDTSWAIGHWMMIDMDESYHLFYYIMSDAEPTMPFLRYKHESKQEPEFTDKMEHGYMYMPVIKFKELHPIFGFDVKG